MPAIWWSVSSRVCRCYVSGEQTVGVHVSSTDTMDCLWCQWRPVTDGAVPLRNRTGKHKPKDHLYKTVVDDTGGRES
jgi:hypothetical protein